MKPTAGGNTEATASQRSDSLVLLPTEHLSISRWSWRLRGRVITGDNVHIKLCFSSKRAGFDVPFAPDSDSHRCLQTKAMTSCGHRGSLFLRQSPPMVGQRKTAGSFRLDVAFHTYYFRQLL